MSRADENIFAQERKQLIVELVNRRVKITVAELCEEFNVSPATVRNDLRELEFAGLLQRTHGGALSNKKVTFDRPYTERLVENQAEKQAIGRLAASLVEEGDKIIIDVGTTTRELALSLAEKQDVTVVTNDLEVAYHMNAFAKSKIFVTGGFLRTNFNTLVGESALNALNDIHVNKAFLSAEGITLDKGATITDMNVASVKKKFLQSADQVILLADSSKFGKTAFTRFADIDQVDMIITDAHADKKILDQYRSHNVKIKIAEVDETAF